MYLSTTIDILDIKHCLYLAKKFYVEIDSWTNTIYKKENEKIDLLLLWLDEWLKETHNKLSFEIINVHDNINFLHTIEFSYFSQFVFQGVQDMINHAKTFDDKSADFSFLLSKIKNCHTLIEDLKTYESKSDYVRLIPFNL